MFTFQLRGGTAAQWQAANPVLKFKEPGLETDTKIFKVGDGVTPWNALPVFMPNYLQQTQLNAYIQSQVANASPISDEDVEQITEQVLLEIELPDLVLLWENAKA